MKVKSMSPVMARFRTLMPWVFTSANFMSQVLFRPTKTCSNTESRMYSSTMLAGRPKPVQ